MSSITQFLHLGAKTKTWALPTCEPTPQLSGRPCGVRRHPEDRSQVSLTARLRYLKARAAAATYNVNQSPPFLCNHANLTFLDVVATLSPCRLSGSKSRMGNSATATAVK